MSNPAAPPPSTTTTEPAVNSNANASGSEGNAKASADRRPKPVRENRGPRKDRTGSTSSAVSAPPTPVTENPTAGSIGFASRESSARGRPGVFENTKQKGIARDHSDQSSSSLATAAPATAPQQQQQQQQHHHPRQASERQTQHGPAPHQPDQKLYSLPNKQHPYTHSSVSQDHRERSQRDNMAAPRRDPGRILLLGDVQGKLQMINTLVQNLHADAVVVVGNFGFFDAHSHEVISEGSLRTVLTRLDASAARMSLEELHSAAQDPASKFTELLSFINKENSFSVPVHVVWGKDEDVKVIDKFRARTYHVPNLFLADEAHSVRIGDFRIFGLSGAVDAETLFDHGEHSVNSYGGHRGSMWATMLQVGKLVYHADHLPSDEREIRLLASFAGANNSPLVAALAVALHAEYVVSNTTASVCGSFGESMLNGFEQRTQAGLAQIKDLFQSIEYQLFEICTEEERRAFDAALSLLTATRSTPHQPCHIMLPEFDCGHASIQSFRGRASLHTVTEHPVKRHLPAPFHQPKTQVPPRHQKTAHETVPSAQTSSERVRPAPKLKVVVDGGDEVTEADVRDLLRDCKIQHLSRFKGGYTVELEDAASLKSAQALDGTVVHGQSVSVRTPATGNFSSSGNRQSGSGPRVPRK